MNFIAYVATVAGLYEKAIASVSHNFVDTSYSRGNDGYSHRHSLKQGHGSVYLHHHRDDKVGTFARRLAKEMESLWVFLEHEGVSPINNHAERMLRFAVL